MIGKLGWLANKALEKVREHHNQQQQLEPCDWSAELTADTKDKQQPQDRLLNTPTAGCSPTAEPPDDVSHKVEDQLRSCEGKLKIQSPIKLKNGATYTGEMLDGRKHG